MNQHFWPTNPLFDLYNQCQRLGEAFQVIQQENLQLGESLAQQLLIQRELLSQQQHLSPTNDHPESNQLKKNPRRRTPISKNNQKRLNRPQPYTCPYEHCTRVYKSSIALNLHIKINHNGGTKKEREAYAKQIIKAEEGLCEKPQKALNLPPNFIEEYRKTYSYTKKYNM